MTHPEVASYNSLTDPHLSGYFANPRLRKQLRQVGLIRRNGAIVSETTIQMKEIQKKQHLSIQNEVTKLIRSKADDFNRNQELLINRTMGDIINIQKVRKVRGDSAGTVGDLNLIKYKVVPPSVQKQSYSLRPIRPSSSIERNSYGGLNHCSRPSTANISIHGDGRRSRSSALSVYQLDHGLSKLRLASPNRRRRRSLSPFMKKSSGRQSVTPKNHRRKHHHWRSRQTTLSYNQDFNENSLSDKIVLTMRYYGTGFHLDDQQYHDSRDEVVVEQQHCGGNTLILYRDKIFPETDFTITSHRHPGFPFSLTIYVNGRHNTRLSACCEYKHKISRRLGGSKGHFAIVGISGGEPCYKCCVNIGKRKKRGRKPRNSLRSEGRTSNGDERTDDNDNNYGDDDNDYDDNDNDYDDNDNDSDDDDYDDDDDNNTLRIPVEQDDEYDETYDVKIWTVDDQPDEWKKGKENVWRISRPRSGLDDDVGDGRHNETSADDLIIPVDDVISYKEDLQSKRKSDYYYDDLETAKPKSDRESKEDSSDESTSNSYDSTADSKFCTSNE